jgi:DNA-binding response OmpR family regulator
MGSARPILIVEDDEDLVAVLRSVLEEDGYQVLSASDGAVALSACRERPVLALVDLHLPGELTGAQLVSALRFDLPADARLVLLSGERDVAARALELGADGALEKPFDIEELLRLVREASDHARTDGHAPQPS